MKFMRSVNDYKKHTIKFPEEYQPLNKKLPSDMPKDAVGCGVRTDYTCGIIMAFGVSEEMSMKFGDEQRLIDELHETMDDNLGLIEVKAGQTAAGREYIYSIRKLRDETEGIPKCVYLLNFNIRFEKGIQFISGSFDEVGMTGIRDSLAYSMMRNEGGPLEGKEFGDLEGWCADPYDPNFKRGFLMNLSEDERLDEMFSTHPLSVARKFVKDIISLN